MRKNDKQQALVPLLRFPEFRDDAPWQKKRLKQLFDERTDKGGEELPLLSLTDAEGLIHQKDSGRKDNSNADKSRYARVCPGDIAYNTMRMWEGRSALACEAGLVSPAYTVCIPKDNVDSQFFAYYFKTAQAIAQFRRFSQGLVKDTLSLKFDRFAKIQLPTTSPAEQQKIADCLDSLDDMIAAEGRKLAALRDHKKGLTQQLFPREGETRPRLRFPEFRDSEDWEEKPLKSFANYQNGKAYEKDICEDGRFVVVNSRFVSTDGAVRKFTNAEYCTACRGDVLMVLSDLPNGRALAKCFLVDEDYHYAVNQRVARLTPKSIEASFMHYLLNRNRRLLAFDDGITQTHLSKGNVTDCLFNLPRTLDEQRRIADCLSSLDALVAARAEKLDTLRAHKRGLMQQLFPSPESAEA